MSSIPVITPENANPQVQEMFAKAKAKMGKVPNVLGVMANAPPVLGIYLDSSGHLGSGTLEPKIREQIAIAIAAANGCEYCLSAHTTIGKGTGLSPTEMDAAQDGHANDAKAQAAVTLALELRKNFGNTSKDLLQEARKAGLTDAEVLEIAGHVALNVLTNSINNLAKTEVDFPKATLRTSKAA